jgi:hypothetical protein
LNGAGAFQKNSIIFAEKAAPIQRDNDTAPIGFAGCSTVIRAIHALRPPRNLAIDHCKIPA